MLYIWTDSNESSILTRLLRIIFCIWCRTWTHVGPVPFCTKDCLSYRVESYELFVPLNNFNKIQILSRYVFSAPLTLLAFVGYLRSKILSLANVFCKGMFSVPLLTPLTFVCLTNVYCHVIFNRLDS